MKKFNPTEYLAENTLRTPVRTIPCGCPSIDTTADIEIITERIERARTDIASTYADWRDLGFALSDELGEAGRTYYHRISRYYPKYDYPSTEKQYDACINARGHGITIRTFYQLAKTAGINIHTGGFENRSNEKKEKQQSGLSLSFCPSVPKTIIDNTENQDNSSKKDDAEGEDTSEDTNEDVKNVPIPTLPNVIYENIPDFLKKIVLKATSPEDRDVLLLGSITVLSACLPNIYGMYSERFVFPNLFLFVTAQASAGKGRLTLCRKLAEPIHKALREKDRIQQLDYKNKLADYLSQKDKSELQRPEEPPMLMFIIPANTSATGLFQILNDNKGVGLIFETEGDTLAQSFKSEHGNYSDGLRKSWHHESISYNRRKNREYVELEQPKVSALLSGTPQQVASLIPNTENGLFSRFMFYYINLKPVWIDVFANSDKQPLDEYFENLGNEFYDLYKILQQHPTKIKFTLTTKQQQSFHKHFTQAQDQYMYLCGTDYIATVRRLGLITFRIAMILSTLRIMETGNFTINITCTDNDFDIAINIVKLLIQHAAQIYQRLPAEIAATAKPNPRQHFLEALPDEFTYKIFISTAATMSIQERTAKRYIVRFTQSGLIEHPAHDKYKKTK
ncbi:hypothetical protein FACS1894199_16520 [Bacteroidia bacterium]|nr:hypothetical protein FACS1894199_16520 [Bacteroidia bacterium]